MELWRALQRCGILVSCKYLHLMPWCLCSHVGSAKYALATVNRLVDELGSDQTVGHDIACSFSATLRNSSISQKVATHRLTMSVNAFHGHAHNRICQLTNHPLYRTVLGLEDLETCERVFSASNSVARVIRFASHFHWQQFLDLHFKQWNEDRYADISGLIFILRSPAVLLTIEQANSCSTIISRPSSSLRNSRLN